METNWNLKMVVVPKIKENLTHGHSYRCVVHVELLIRFTLQH